MGRGGRPLDDEYLAGKLGTGSQSNEPHERAAELLRAAIQEGEDSGPPMPFAMSEYLRAKKPN